MLIGLHGKAQSGKSTVAEHLFKHGFNEVTFAFPLKNLVVDLFDMSWDQVIDNDFKERIDLRYGMSPRKILQYLGTDVFRQMYPNIWIDYLIRKINKLKETNKTVVSDVRFKNEKDAIEKEGGYVWKIVRRGSSGPSSGFEGHASECDLDSVPDSDYSAVLVAESGDIEGLLGKADQEVSKILKEKK
jgi:hypothetical protein